MHYTHDGGMHVCTCCNLAGLQYAQEVESKDDKEPPSYFCNLCNILSESGNYHLHFSSSNHRSNVLVRVENVSIYIETCSQ